MASGVGLIVDVEFSRGPRLHSLSRGIWNPPVPPENEGAPASPNTGKVMRIDGLRR